MSVAFLYSRKMLDSATLTTSLYGHIAQLFSEWFGNIAPDWYLETSLSLYISDFYLERLVRPSHRVRKSGKEHGWKVRKRVSEKLTQNGRGKLWSESPYGLESKAIALRTGTPHRYLLARPWPSDAQLHSWSAAVASRVSKIMSMYWVKSSFQFGKLDVWLDTLTVKNHVKERGY